MLLYIPLTTVTTKMSNHNFQVAQMHMHSLNITHAYLSIANEDFLFTSGRLHFSRSVLFPKPPMSLKNLFRCLLDVEWIYQATTQHTMQLIVKGNPILFSRSIVFSINSTLPAPHSFQREDV